MLMIKSKLCELIMSGQLEVGPVMDYLVRFQNLDQFDLMIAALLALRDTLPVDCPLRQELGQLTVYAIYRRCQSRNSVNNNVIYPPFVPSFPLLPSPMPMPLPVPVPQPSPIPVPVPVPTPTPVPVPVPVQPQQQISCETLADLIRYFQYLYEQYSCQECASSLGPIPYRQFTKRSNQQQRRSIDLSRNNLLETPLPYSKPVHENLPFQQLITLLPTPKNAEESAKYNKVVTFIKSNEMRNSFRDLTPADFNDKQKLFNLVVQKISQSNVDISIKEAFSFYLSQISQASAAASFDYSSLVDLLPQPLDNEEKEKFEIVKLFLGRTDIHNYLKAIDASVYADRKLLLKTVLKILASSKLDAKITEAFTYYLNYQESLTELELFTKKEITKHFELTKIFIDTLRIDSLSKDAKLAFKKFFKYISSITKDQLKNFDSWSEVKTKGEFMKALFKYLVDQPFVPNEVKEAINKLEPLVQMDGRGAAPP
ncbi:hypothetical protein ILUMI_27531 [Ignelater luminosus]|uniref:Uncharacterized protein n=1 Tax=Ignelater luminosus TaxID=2038154 RepID=A0A8K0C4U7_IGNLU|nr:hypothetical protein ILUMI_27531 [Ignelater luminosus]